MTATASTCAGCGRPVLMAPALGKLLELEWHSCGIFVPDGGGRKITYAEVRDGRHGHHEHRCPEPVQVDLFDGGCGEQP